MKVGDYVRVTSEEDPVLESAVGVVVELDEADPIYKYYVRFSNLSRWWYSSEELQPATRAEILEDKLLNG